MLTLLSPAKTLDLSPVTRKLTATEPYFESDVPVLMKRCKKLSVRSLERLMNLSRPLAELNRQRFQDMSWPMDAERTKPCILAFAGDVYRGLDAAALTKRDLEWAQRRLRVLSGFYGLLRPLDRIEPYRLEMGTRLSNTRGKDLYSFWKNRIVDRLNEEHAAGGFAAVLNLASIEYFRAVPAKRLEAPLIEATFKEIRDGQPRTISFFAKRARGLMARYVVKHRVGDPEALKDFSEEGYEYRDDLSTERQWVFARHGTA